MMSSKLHYLMLVCALALPTVSFAGSPPLDDLQFQVLLDDKPIGTHQFRIRDESGRRTIEIDAKFDVRVLFVPVYSYRHNNTEVWRDGCLARIESKTDANGENFAVEGRKSGGAYEIATATTTASYPVECLMSFAYWDQRMLQQERLLNAQTGEVVEVAIERIGEKALVLGSTEVLADGYRIVSATPAVDIKVWYAKQDGRWVSLESRLESGRLMRYIPAEADKLALTESDSNRIRVSE